VNKLRQANPDKDISEETVEACFWGAVNIRIRDTKAKDFVAKAIIDEGRKVMQQARNYWNESSDHEVMSNK